MRAAAATAAVAASCGNVLGATVRANVAASAHAEGPPKITAAVCAHVHADAIDAGSGAGSGAAAASFRKLFVAIAAVLQAKESKA